MSRVPRFYCEEALTVGATVSLLGSAHHHLAHVLRLRTGADVCLFNGDGINYLGHLGTVTRHAAAVELTSSETAPAPSNLPTTLAIGVSKARLFDLALQKATELGVQRIIPFAAARSPGHETRANRKQEEHWRGVLISACEQCGRAEIPVLKAVTDISGLTAAAPEPGELRLLLDPLGEPLSSDAPAPAGALLCCGPEGGLTQTEKDTLKAHGYQAVSCGPRILRTETAPMVMLTLLQYLWGDFR